MRPIDADELKEPLLEAIKDAPLYIQATVDQYIDETPTLIPQNETLTCKECIHEENEHQNCNYCVRAPYLGDYYYHRHPRDRRISNEMS